jgi:tetratricopeptide (TPR) repeat protein
MDSMGKHPRRVRSAATGGRGRIEEKGEARAKAATWWWLALPVAVVALVAFAPALDGGFIDIDDEEGFVKNQGFRGLGWPQVAWAATTRTVGVYQPVAWWIAEVDYAISGLDPRAIHLSSLLIHAATAAALFFLIRALLARAIGSTDPAGRRREAIAAAVAASAYAAHPLRASSVAWATAIGYPPCGLFVVLSVLAYLRAAGSSRRGAYLAWLGASVAAYAAALGAHAVPLGLPLVLLVLDIYPLRRFEPGSRSRWIRLALEKLPFVALAGAFAAAALWARGGGEGVASLDQVGVGERLLHASYSLWFYVAKSLVPTALRAIYPMPARFAWTEPRFALAALGVLAFVAAAVAWRRRRPWLAAAGGCYVLILLPNTGLVRNISVVAADHYSYVATIPLAALAAAGVVVVLGRFERRPGASFATLAACGAVVVGLVAMGRAQARTWHDSVAVWTRNVEANPTPDAYFQTRLGRALLDAGRPQEARVALLRALQIAPEFPLAHNKLGLVLLALSRPDEAAAEFAEAVRIAPTYVEARINNGYSLARAGRLDAAAEEFAAAAQLQPGLIEAQSNLGAARSQQGRHAEASAAFERAVALDPSSPDARMNLGYALLHLDRFDAAAAQYAEAARLRPTDAGARHNLGHCLARLDRHDEAAACYTEALRLDPNMAESRRGLDELLQARAVHGTLRR